MEEKLELKDFDILGIINLKDVQGIEKYVTPIIEQDGNVKEYLSRSKEYYNVKTMTELSVEREELKKLLTRQINKKNFVILENMLNCSAKVYFKKFEKYIQSGKNEENAKQLEQAEKCLIEDSKNILVLLSGKGLVGISKENRLPKGMENSEKRAIEMDNKAILYLWIDSLKFNKDEENVEVLTPGYGSIYIGPFLKAMYGYNFTNMLKSKYIEDTTQNKEKDILSVMSSNRILGESTTALLVDDNIGTGDTMKEIKQRLKEEGVSKVISGAVQYNWRNYLRVSVGDKTDINRFEINDFNIVSPINYAGHKLYTRAINMLHSSGKEYIQYLNLKSYRLKGYSDLQGALERGIFYARKTGLEMAEGRNVPNRTIEGTEVLEKYKDKGTAITNDESEQIIKDIIENIDDACIREKCDKGLEIE